VNRLYMPKWRPKTLTLEYDKSSLPDGINDVFLDIDYTGTWAGIYKRELVDDHFYFGQPWRIGLKRFLARLPKTECIFRFGPFTKSAVPARLVGFRGSRLFQAA